MLDKEDVKKTMLFFMETHGHTHYVLVKDNVGDEDEQRIAIEDIHDHFGEKNDMRLYNYFQSLINLCASISMQRNYKCIQALQSVYTLDMVIDCTLNEALPYALRACFARLLIRVHMDKDPLEKLNIPIMTRVWDQVEAEEV